jgi:hypothetical protein
MHHGLVTVPIIVFHYEHADGEKGMENLKLLGETQPGPKCPEQVCAI